MRTYIAVRVGSNAANQSMTPEMVVGSVKAKTWQEAVGLARRQFHCYQNQHIYVVAYSRAGDDRREELRQREMSAMHEEIGLGLLAAGCRQ